MYSSSTQSTCKPSTLPDKKKKKLNQCQHYHKNMGCAALFHLHMPPKAWKITITSIKKVPQCTSFRVVCCCCWGFFCFGFHSNTHKKRVLQPLYSAAVSDSAVIAPCSILLHTGKGKTGRVPCVALDRHFLLSPPMQHMLPPSRQPAKGAFLVSPLGINGIDNNTVQVQMVADQHVSLLCMALGSRLMDLNFPSSVSQQNSEALLPSKSLSFQ